MSDLSDLSNAKHILITQRIEWLEIIPCYEEINEYEISTTDVDFSAQKTHIGTVVEKPGSCFCLFCCKALREYENELRVNSFPVASSSRPYKVPICQYAFISLCKPEIQIHKGSQMIGAAEWPCWHPCFPARGCLSCQEFDIKDAAGNVQYTITARCLQLGFLCPILGVLEPCSRREYIIMDATKQQVGKIVNIYNGVVEECCTRADRFGIEFPDGCSIDQKLVLIKTAVFLDYIQYFA